VGVAREIIVGYDGTARGADALALGRALADALSPARLVSVTVGGPDQRPAAPSSRGTNLSGTEVETRTLSDDSPAHALHALAEAEEPILIVLGSTHRGPLGRVLIGSVGEALLSGAPCAIAVAPGDYAAREEQRLLRIGVAVNGSAESWPALDAGIRLAQRLNAAFTLIAVAGPQRRGIGAGSSVPAPDPASLRQEGMVRALDEATDRVPTDLPVARRLLRGDPADELAEAAEDFDLLILGSRGYGPLRSVLLGGASAKLMRTAPCPILVLPRGAGDDPLSLAEEAT
jgi:nucleotide-binding universal stress UspA family protein